MLLTLDSFFLLFLSLNGSAVNSASNVK
jgi:hypothetical protein